MASRVSAPSDRGPGRRGLQHLWVPGALLLGVLVGLVLPSQAGGGGKGSAGYQRLSEVLGWTYFCAWSVSFYPQIVLNFERRSVLGLSLDYTVLNLLGFGFYFLFNALLFWDSHVQEEYRQSYGGNSAVRLNDVFFSGHAFLVTAVTLAQIGAFYDYPPLERSERCLRMVVLGSVTGVVLAALSLALVIWAGNEESLTWLQYVSMLSETKLAISVVKYCPQVWMNFRRKSTSGWNIYNVLLDFTGGLLSVLQLLLDCWMQADWSKVSGDPVKLLLGFSSMIFDTVFMLQHYCLYPETARAMRSPALEGQSPPRPLLAADALQQSSVQNGPAIDRA